MKVTTIGDKCYQCGTPVILKEAKITEKKLRTDYWIFTHFLSCPNCKKVYTHEKSKVDIKKYKEELCKKQPSLL